MSAHGRWFFSGTNSQLPSHGWPKLHALSAIIDGFLVLWILEAGHELIIAPKFAAHHDETRIGVSILNLDLDMTGWKFWVNTRQPAVVNKMSYAERMFLAEPLPPITFKHHRVFSAVLKTSWDTRKHVDHNGTWCTPKMSLSPELLLDTGSLERYWSRRICSAIIINANMNWEQWCIYAIVLSQASMGSPSRKLYISTQWEWR